MSGLSRARTYTEEQRRGGAAVQRGRTNTTSFDGEPQCRRRNGAPGAASPRSYETQHVCGGGRKHHCLPRVFLSEHVRRPAEGNRSTLEYERSRPPVLVRRGQIVHEHVKPFWALCFWPGQQRTLGAKVGTAGDKKVPETGFFRVLWETSFVPAFLGDGTGEPGLYCQCHSAEAAPG